ncbi:MULTISPECIES: TcfC E-set like domain-containing protein [unclassified Cedecea]|uniref:TcfC E-set like domain-containing protein n=2 Tax=Cedecea TaxID=158483 RepID=UPI003015FDA6
MNIRFTFLAVMISAYSVSLTSNASLRVPRGFEELARGQTILTEVSLYGQSLGVFKSWVDLESIQFIQPDALISSILRAYPDNPRLSIMLHKSLDKPFRRNSQLSCSTGGNQPGCDFLDTQTVDVIYDENNGRINLFIARDYLPAKKQDNIYYDVSAESRNALIHQQNVNFVADWRYQSVSLQGNGTLGVSDGGYLNLDWNLQGQRSGNQSTHDVSVNNAYIRQDFLKRIYVQAGVMDARDIFSNTGGNINLSQLPLGKISGVRTGSTLAWINMDKVSTGTPVNLFLSRDARVDAYREGQLLASFYLKAGAQILDSRAFPQGSYTLTLRIFEDNQLVRTETVPYIGLGELSSRTLQWFIQAGVPDADGIFSERTDRQVVQAGLRLPVSNNLALTTGSAFFNTARFWESALDWAHGFDSRWLDGLLTSRVSYLHGSEGSRGNIQQANYSDGFSLSFYRSAMTAPECNSQGLHRYSINGCYKSSSVMFSVPLDKWYATLGFARNSNRGRYVYRRDIADFDPRDRAAVPWERIYQTHSESRTWQAGLTRTINLNDINITSGINAFFRNDSAFNAPDKGMFITLSFSASRNGVDGKRSTFSGGANWQTSKRGDDGLGYNIAASQYSDETGENETGVSLNGVNTGTLTASAYGRVGGQYGAGSLTVSDAWDRTSGEHLLNGSGNYSSSLILDRDGLAAGRWGDGTPSSAITVGVEQQDTPEVSRVNVSVDTGGRSEVRGNSRALFTVPGYRENQFDVTESVASPEGISSEISRGTGARKVFMTPGKVFNRAVSVQTRYTWLGQLLDNNRHPLEGVIPLNVMAWTPLGNGSFTLQTTRKVEKLYVVKNESYWQCGMKVSMMRDVIRYVGETRCQRTDLARLPAAEQKQVVLMTAGLSDHTKNTAMNN